MHSLSGRRSYGHASGAQTWGHPVARIIEQVHRAADRCCAKELDCAGRQRDFDRAPSARRRFQSQLNRPHSNRTPRTRSRTSGCRKSRSAAAAVSSWASCTR